MSNILSVGESAVEDGKVKGIISAGCVYTLAYLIRMELKRQEIYRLDQTLRLRSMLNIILSLVTVASVSHKRIVMATNDPAFDDLEDSYQYQCAVQNKCDAIVTINLKDYSRVDTSKIEILSPSEFDSKYL